MPGVQPLGVPGRGLHGCGQDSLPPRMRQVQTVRQGGASAGIIIIINYYYYYWQALTSASINEHQLQLYCSLCYANIFQTGVRQLGIININIKINS